jgi:hypothetical protein
MSHSEHEKKIFIQMRGQGFSFSQISEDTNIPKTTLFEWSKRYAPEIAALEFDKSQEMLSKYQLTPHTMFEDAVVELDKVRKEIKSRELGRVNFKTLLEMQARLEKKVMMFELNSWEAMERTHEEKKPGAVSAQE